MILLEDDSLSTAHP